MARQRDYRAEYASRKAKMARETGATYTQVMAARRAGKPLAGDTGARAPRQRNVIKTGGGVLLTTRPPAGDLGAQHSGWGTVLRGLIAREDWTLSSVQMMVRTDLGPVAMDLFKKGGRASTVANGAGDYGGGPQGLRDYLQAVLDASNYAAGVVVGVAIYLTE